jgi:hypothetical protein
VVGANVPVGKLVVERCSAHIVFKRFGNIWRWDFEWANVRFWAGKKAWSKPFLKHSFEQKVEWLKKLPNS